MQQATLPESWPVHYAWCAPGERVSVRSRLHMKVCSVSTRVPQRDHVRDARQTRPHSSRCDAAWRRTLLIAPTLPRPAVRPGSPQPTHTAQCQKKRSRLGSHPCAHVRHSTLADEAQVTVTYVMHLICARPCMMRTNNPADVARQSKPGTLHVLQGWADVHRAAGMQATPILCVSFDEPFFA